MKTTVEIDDPLLRRAKERAARDGTTLRALMERALENHLAEPIAQSSYKWKITPFEGDGFADEFKDASWSKIRNAAYGLPDDE